MTKELLVLNDILRKHGIHFGLRLVILDEYKRTPKYDFNSHELALLVDKEIYRQFSEPCFDVVTTSTIDQDFGRLMYNVEVIQK